MSTAGAKAILGARGLRKEYGHEEGLVRAVDEVDLDVLPGETVAIMGPSGCGKSTLLHLLGGLDRPSGGEVWLEGHRLDQMGERAMARMRRQSVGFVFQAFHLMDDLAQWNSTCRRFLIWRSMGKQLPPLGVPSDRRYSDSKNSNAPVLSRDFRSSVS